MTERDEDKDYEQKRTEYMQRIQEARQRGDHATETQLQLELNYMDDAHYHN